jgi:hypothetical protein
MGWFLKKIIYWGTVDYKDIIDLQSISKKPTYALSLNMRMSR